MFLIRCLKRVASILLAVVLISGIFVAYQGYTMYSEGLKQMDLKQMRDSIRSKPDYTPLEKMPKTYLNGVIATEDKRFYRHNGVDPIAIGRAILHDIQTQSLAEGGSTITQQLAKNMYFSQEKRFSRKAAEIIMASKLEKTFTKDEILELYLNSIYFGNGFYSVAEASRGYFGKSPMELNEDECIMLAGIPNAPSVYNPVDNPTLAEKRQNQVRAQMIKSGYLNSRNTGILEKVHVTFSGFPDNKKSAPLTDPSVLISYYLRFCVSFT